MPIVFDKSSPDAGACCGPGSPFVPVSSVCPSIVSVVVTSGTIVTEGGSVVCPDAQCTLVCGQSPPALAGGQPYEITVTVKEPGCTLQVFICNPGPECNPCVDGVEPGAPGVVITPLTPTTFNVHFDTPGFQALIKAAIVATCPSCTPDCCVIDIITAV